MSLIAEPPPRRSPPRSRAFAAAGALALVLLGFAGGTAVFEYEVWPHGVIHRAFESVGRSARPTDRVLRTQFVDVEVTQADYGFPATARQHGAFAVVGDALLILLNDDLAVLDPETLERTPLPVEMPDTGRAALHDRADPDAPPQYVRNGWHRRHDLAYRAPFLYHTFSEYDADADCVRSALVRLRVRGAAADLRATAADWERLHATDPCLPVRDGLDGYGGHLAGGRLTVAADGAVLWAVGDYGQDGLGGRALPQDPAAAYGKVWRFDPATGALGVFSVGHRNPQGLTVTADGAVWATEHGPEGGDELNRLVAGADYGWPRASYGTDYGARVWPGALRQGRHDGFAEPAWAWTPSVGVSELVELRGAHPAWDGDLLVGSLQARALFRVRTAGARVVTMERIPLGDRVRDLEVVRGRVFAVTDDGDVIRLTLRPPVVGADRLAEAGPAAAELAACLRCHNPGAGPGVPSLCGVLGRRVGSDAQASAALVAAGGRWDRGRLAAFLADTEAAVPGTAMPRVAIPDPAVRAELVDRLDVFCP